MTPLPKKPFRAETLDWRDTERDIRERLKELDQVIDAKIEETGFWDSIYRGSFHDNTVARATSCQHASFWLTC